MNKKQNKAVSGIKYFIVIVVLINILASVVPAFMDAWSGWSGGSGDTEYSDLEMVEVAAQVVPDYQGVTAAEGYTMYRFDVTVHNNGTQEEQVDYALYLGSGDGTAFQQSRDPAYSSGTDSRIIPRGRSAVITLYGEVSNDSTTVEFQTYTTPDAETRTFTWELPDTAV